MNHPCKVLVMPVSALQMGLFQHPIKNGPDHSIIRDEVAGGNRDEMTDSLNLRQ